SAGRFAAPLPLASTLLIAPWLRAQFGLPHRGGATAVATGAPLRATHSADGWTLQGRLDDIAYGHVVQNLIVLGLDGGTLVAAELQAGDIAWIHETNLAGEPRDSAEVSITAAGAAVFTSAGHDSASRLLEDLIDVEAIGLSWAMIGAMETVRSLVVGYTNQREQFGRPLSRFQAVKQIAAELAGEISVATAAVQEATALFRGALADSGQHADSRFAIAAARLRTAMAASPVAEAAHQLHGAIGYTREYPLHQFTRSLWSWRDEGRSERQWKTIAGRRALAGGAEHLWQSVAMEQGEHGNANEQEAVSS
ncbi:MAG: hypothetical protein JWO10_1100, partial [Microbacteriaceae bacterium]|nr:hypothetical protein [Microbacteriaceae bacterium]